MGVTFVYRCPHNGPTEKYVKRFEDADLLAWFRRHWVRIVDPGLARQYADFLLGVSVHGFGWFFEEIEPGPPDDPNSVEEAANQLRSLQPIRLLWEDDCVQGLLTDGMGEMAFYLFDDGFVRAHGDLTAYLLHEGEWLPEGTGAVPVGQGESWACLLTPWEDNNLQSLRPEEAHRVPGVRVADWCQHVLTADFPAGGWTCQDLKMRLLQIGRLGAIEGEWGFLQAIREWPAEAVNWMAYSDWLMEQGMPPAGLRMLELGLSRLHGRDDHRVHVREHVAQVHINYGDKEFQHWFLFDDVWAAAHPALADSLLRFATRWDVLSTGDERAL